MQQAFYNSIQNNSGVQAGSPAADTGAARTASVLRWVARKWDLVGMLALMGSSAAYGVFALMHLGL